VVSDEKVLEILKMISNPTRMEILRRIKANQSQPGVACSCVLEGMEISQSTFSHHISELSQSGLVVGKNQGRFVYLTIDEDVWNEFQNQLGPAIFG
jgi:ArsR family transcriptional regulator